MTICFKYLQYAQKVQKQADNKNTKRKNYDPGDKVLLNSKYIKIKQNPKLENTFFGLF